MDSKIVSEYDQEIPQSQTADNPVAKVGPKSKFTPGLHQVKRRLFGKRSEQNVSNKIIEHNSKPFDATPIKKNIEHLHQGILKRTILKYIIIIILSI